MESKLFGGGGGGKEWVDFFLCHFHNNSIFINICKVTGFCLCLPISSVPTEKKIQVTILKSILTVRCTINRGCSDFHQYPKTPPSLLKIKLNQNLHQRMIIYIFIYLFLCNVFDCP